MPAQNRPTPRPAASLELLRESLSQMSFGERAALEGVLVQLSPRLAIEIGTAEGGSLKRLAAHCDEVHAFDLSFDLLDRGSDRIASTTSSSMPATATSLLGETLAEFAREGRRVDFALVDGDHSAEGVKRDIEDLLAAEAVADTVILVHDTMNEVVRAGLEEVAFENHAGVVYVELDFVPGFMFREPSLRDELWGGLGLIVVESGRTRPPEQSPRQQRYYDAHELITRAKHLPAELERHQEWLRAIQGSASWRLTAPLRAAARAGRRIARSRAMTPQIALVPREVYPLTGGGIGAHVGALAELLEGRAEVTIVTTSELEQRYRELQDHPDLPRSARFAFVPEPPPTTSELLRVGASVERAGVRGAAAASSPRGARAAGVPRLPRPGGVTAQGRLGKVGSCKRPAWRCACTPRPRFARSSTASWATTGGPGHVQPRALRPQTC